MKKHTDKDEALLHGKYESPHSRWRHHKPHRSTYMPTGIGGHQDEVDPLLHPGRKVIIGNLSTEEGLRLNGTSGVIIEWNEAVDRWEVSLEI